VTATTPEWFDANQAMWDERVPIHLTSGFYDLDAFRAGRIHIRPVFALTRSLRSLRSCELSQPREPNGVSSAEQVGRLRLLDRVHRYVPEAAAAPPVRALDERAWAERGRFRSGRRCKGRRATCLLDDTGCTPPGRAKARPNEAERASASEGDRPAGEHDDWPGTYADFDAPTVHNEMWEWTHPLSEVVSALLDAGLALEMLHEHEDTYYLRFPFLEEREHGRFHMPAGMPSLPFVFSLRARRP